MVKHGLNSFLALSVTFANELATLCEQVGADAAEVEKGLTAKGFDLIPGDADSALAINPAQNKNLLFEFTE